MAVTKEMIAKKLARTTVAAETKRRPSAQTLDVSETNGATSARARGMSNSSEPTSAQTPGLTKPKPTSSARAKIVPKPKRDSLAQATGVTQPKPPTPAHLLTTIRLLGRTLGDLERLRIMNGNRTGAAERRGIDPFWMATVAPHLDAAEHAAELELKRAWRKHPLAAWAKAIPGAGEVLMGRLVAEIGEPHLREVGHWEGEEAEREWVVASIEPRTVSQLRAYCGHGDPMRAGQIPKGATQEELFKRGSPGAKKAVWKLAYQFMRTVGTDATGFSESNGETRRSPRSPYRDLYEQRKAETEGKLHERSCVRCGPSGKPALPGAAWSDGHRHADALRIIGKFFLADLYEASQAIAATSPSPEPPAILSPKPKRARV